jgi:hypothetical protein
MRRILHILTGSNDELPQKIITIQQADRDYEVIVAELNGPSPDYDALLREIFKADSIELW